MPFRAAEDTSSYVRDRLELRFLEVLRSALLASPKLVAVTIPAPLLTPERVLAFLPSEPAYHFAIGDTQGDVGLGNALTLEAAELDELPRLEQSATQYLSHCFEAGIDAAARPPRFCGGLSFDGPPAQLGPWRSFPRIWFQLPRFRYLTDRTRSTLSLFVRAEEIGDDEQRRQWVERTLSLLDQMNERQEPSRAVPSITSRQETLARTKWLDLVERARDEIRTHNLEKVVLAREITLEFDAPPSVVRMLARLARLSPDTTRFALRRGPSTFLGATPERLVMRRGSDILTEALAGSIRATDRDAAEHLFHSEKERYEHLLVVQEIERKLRHLGAHAERTERPQIRELRQVLHLFTPITARIFRAPHVLSLAAQLHPTPAVGGVPEGAARRFIRDHEGFERGFYAGAIGWFDAAGDGEFFVALRSGLLEGRTLRMYAGAGIVADSDPIREFEETELKFESLLDAIGPESVTTSEEP